MRRSKVSKRLLEKRGGASGGSGGAGGASSDNNSVDTQASTNTTGDQSIASTPSTVGTGRFTVADGSSVGTGERQTWMAAYLNTLTDSLPSNIRDRFSDNVGIGGAILRVATSSPDRIRVIRDADGNMQAATSLEIRSDRVHVSLLATAPWNVTGNDPRSVKGAGKAMMAEIVRESIRQGKNGQVDLYAVPNARGFYESVGFRPIGDGNYFLDAEAARKFLASMED